MPEDRTSPLTDQPLTDKTSSPMTEPGPEHIVARVEAQMRLRIDAPCGDGAMPFRIWGDGEALVLCHGGSGSWTHWLRNIETLARSYRVIVPDLPGLGDAAEIAMPYSPRSAAEVVHHGLQRVLAANEPVHFAAFSWGCTTAAQLSVWRAQQTRSLLLVGPASLGEYPRPAIAPLRKRSRSMSTDELLEVSRYNLQQLMIHNADAIDALAIHLQLTNTAKARFKSPQFVRTTAVLDAVRESTTPLKVLYGEFDQPSYPHIEPRRQRLLEARSDMEFELVPEVGHWSQYEWVGFNNCLLSWLQRHRRQEGV